MALFEEKSEKQSLVITAILSAAIIALLLIFGLTYFDPPKEQGIAINFGTSDVGMGDIQPDRDINSAPTQQNNSEQSQEETQESSAQEKVSEEEVVTEESEDAPTISNDKVEQKTSENPDNKKEEEQKEEKPKPQPDKSTSDALSNVINGKKHEGSSTQGEGDDNIAGDKGDINGDPNAKSYYGQGTGLDGDGNYRLGGRKALNKKKYVQNCNESGIVVVEIKVNRQGKVVKATPGVKGTTNTNSCLLDPAMRAALETRFNVDADAPSIQTGFIVYDFKISD